MAKFQLINIVLLECTFKRMPLDAGDPDPTENKLNLEITRSTSESNDLAVTLTIRLTQKREEDSIVEATIVKAGLFKILEDTEDTSDPPLSVDDFARVNAPAIIFPFIRETMASLSCKAGISPIILQPINFVDFTKGAGKKKE